MERLPEDFFDLLGLQVITRKCFFNFNTQYRHKEDIFLLDDKNTLSKTNAWIGLFP